VNENLNEVEVRTLGSLIEKQVTTPEYYPMTLNSLVNACNQLTNREPVVKYDEKTVARSLEDLREKQLIWVVSQAGSRVPKYEQRLTEALRLSEQETATLCVLMLRGPQTPGEIRGRTGRLYEFKELEEVELTIQSLSTAEPRPLVTKLPRLPGTKESRFAHLLSGEVKITEPAEARVRPEAAMLEVRGENERLARLEQRIESLEGELAALKQTLMDFKKQFE
jgi:uncharacterized protein YceH (UPF0502 family)